MFGIGEFPIGGFPDSDSESIADPLPGLISDPLLAREFLFRSVPDGNTVDLSSGGYNSHPTDTPYKLFPSGIQRPYNFSVELPLPNLTGGASTGAGEIRFTNPDGSLDETALHDWLGADTDVYIGPKSAELSQFTRFNSGKSAGVTWDLESFSILHRDLRFKLQKRLQPNRYWGFGSCLRFDGSGDNVDYGDILDQGATNSFTVEWLFRSTATGIIQVLGGKKAGFTSEAGWAVFINSSNNLIARVADGIGSVAVTITGFTTSYLDGRLRRLSIVVDRINQSIRVYVDGVFIGSSTTISAIGSLTNALTLQVGQFASANSWNGDLDDFRFWSKVRTQAEIQADMHREITAQSGLEIYSKFNESSGTSASDSSGNSRTGTITGATWVGSLEGDESLAGTPKPALLGIKRQISPKLVDPQRLVYQLHDGSMEAIDDVLDGGDPYTFGSDVSDIYGSTPAAGSYNTCLAKGLFRLNSSPVGVITCIARGDNSSPGYVDDLSGIHKKVSKLYGGLTDDDLNLDTYTSLAAKTSASIGFYFDNEINVDVALDEIMRTGGGGWWTPDRISRISVGRIDNPSTLTADVEVTIDDLVDPRFGGSFKRTPVGVRVGEVVLGYRKYNTTLSTDQVSGIIDDATRLDLGQPHRFVTATDPDRSIDSDTLTVLTEIDNQADAQVEADRLLALWKEDRGVYRVAMSQNILSYFIGTVFNVTVDRYDTVSGKKFMVFGITEDMGQYGQTDRLEVGLFG